MFIVDVDPHAFLDVIDALKVILDPVPPNTLSAGDEIIFCEWVQPLNILGSFDINDGYYSGLRYYAIVQAVITNKEMSTIYLVKPGKGN